MAVNFDATPLGDYTQAAFNSDWGNHQGVMGLGTGRAAIVDGAEAYSGHALRLEYPKGTFGGQDQAIHALVVLPTAYKELYVSYRVRFGDGFDFVRGGKLPGLLGGASVVGGGIEPTGQNGWSGRMMWLHEGHANQEIYHPDQPEPYGELFGWGRKFEPGKWHTVEHHFTMNTPGLNDGVFEGRFDGQWVVRINDLRFRDVDTFAISSFYLTSFFGGGDDTWQATKDEYISFDDFVISTEPIEQ